MYAKNIRKKCLVCNSQKNKEINFFKKKGGKEIEVAGLWTTDSGFILEIKDNEALDLAAWLTDMFT